MIQNIRKNRANKRGNLFVPLFLMFFLLIVFSCAPGDKGNNDENGSAPSGNEKHNEMLDSLGLNVNSVEARLDPQNNPLPDDYNPLGQKIGSFNPTKELYFVKGGSLILREFTTNNGWQTLFTKNAPWVSYPSSSSKITNADIDGDGFDEIIIVYELRNAGLKQIKLIVIDDKSEGYAESDPIIISERLKTASGPNLIESIEAANLDSDVAKELIVNASGTIYLFDDKNSGFSRLGYKQFATGITATHSFTLDLSVGNIDNDPEDEFVIVQNIHNEESSTRIVNYFVYDSSLTTLLKSDNNITVSNSSGTHPMDKARCAFGDIDGDGLDELIFYGYEYATPTVGSIYLINFDDAQHNLVLTGGMVLQGGVVVSDFAIKSLDIDGDNVDEILITVADRFIRIFDDIKFHSMGTPIGSMINLSANYPNMFSISVGNINEDRFDNFVVRYKQSTRINVYEYDDNTRNVTATATFSSTPPNFISGVGLANVDKDSIVLKYRNEHELLFTDPTVLAVISAPPFHKSLGENQAGSSTVFGQARQQGSSEMNEFGFNVGASVGVSLEAPLCGSTCFSATAKWKIEAAFDWATTHSYQREETFYYTAVQEDQVVFTAIPFDVYYYDVISAGVDSATSVGKIVTINIPRKPLKTSAERIFYNNHNGNSPDITETLIRHKVGVVGSYMSENDKNTIIATLQCNESSKGCLYSSRTEAVGIGNSSSTIEISQSTADSSGFSFNGNISYEAEVTAGGVLAGVSAGFHYGYNITTETGEKTIISGTVGQISPSAYSSGLSYKWGILSYPATLPGTQHQFALTNFWIQDYNP